MGPVRRIAIFLSIIVTVIAVALSFLLMTPQGAAIVADRALAFVLGPGNVVYARVEGSLWRGVRFFHVEVRRPYVLRDGAVIRFQELNMRLARFALDGVELSLVNARVIDPKADPIVVNGVLSNGRYKANIFSQSLDLGVLRQVIRHFRNPPELNGELGALDLTVTGTPQHPALTGRFAVDHIVQHGFVLSDALVRCSLHFKKFGGFWSMYGRMFIEKGTLKAPHAVIQLSMSRVNFNGDLYDPELDINGTSTVAHARIEIQVKGTRKAPEVRLSSDGTSSQEQLMLMLATGKRWDGLDVSMTSGRMTPELAGDFVDYFFFGGSGQRLARFFGLSGVRYKIDQTTMGVTFNKNVADRLDVDYGVAVNTGAPGEGQPREIIQTVGSAYRLTDAVTVEAQKEILPVTSVVNGVTTHRIPDDRVFLKYRRKF